MTGRELLVQRMLEAGMNKAQTTAKVVDVVLELLAESAGEEILNVWHSEKHLRTLEEKISHLEPYVRDLEAKKSFEWKYLNFDRKRFEDEKKTWTDWLIKAGQELDEYKQKFEQSLNECDNPEGRDALRAAQLFINSVKIKTAYDNTAFIIGLAAILSHGNVAPINELRKINSKIPTVEISNEILQFCPPISHKPKEEA